MNRSNDGVPGRGLSGVAARLLPKGLDVTGSGASVSWLSATGARHTRLLIHGPEVGRAHPVRRGAARRDVRRQTAEEWLAEQFAGRLGAAFCGGREASAAAAMAGLVLTLDGQDPSVLLGTPAPQFGGSARLGLGRPFVVEWPGAVTGLDQLGPRLAVLLGPDRDDPAPWTAVVEGLAEALGTAGTVLAVGHPSWLTAKARRSGIEWLSLRRGADWWATDFREESGRFRFRIFHRGRYVIEVRLRARGLRYVVGALAATATCVKLGVAAAAIREGLEEFVGLSRDFESRGSFRGVTLVDDEADDPGLVYDALSLARRVFQGRRLWVVFAPVESVSQAEARRYASALTLADRLTIIDQGPSTPTLPRPLSAALQAAGVRVDGGGGGDVAATVSELDRDLEPGDVLLTLGGGDVGTIADGFIRRLSRDRPGG